MSIKKCKYCKKPILSGRSDKLFCDVNCKNSYHHQLRKKTNIVAIYIDEILHRNRSILYELMGDRSRQLKIAKLTLAKKKFQFDYHTHITVNSRGKTYHNIYDFAWMSFSDDEILIVRNIKKYRHK